jgi:hypothetical protein
VDEQSGGRIRSVTRVLYASVVDRTVAGVCLVNTVDYAADEHRWFKSGPRSGLSSSGRITHTFGACKRVNLGPIGPLRYTAL